MDGVIRQTARQRIQILFTQAKKTYKDNPELAKRYVATARRIAMAAKIRIPKEYKRQACKGCNSLLVPGETSRVRVRSRRETHVTVTCLACGNQKRVPLRKRLKEKAKVEQNNIKNETSRST